MYSMEDFKFDKLDIILENWEYISVPINCINHIYISESRRNNYFCFDWHKRTEPDYGFRSKLYAGYVRIKISTDYETRKFSISGVGCKDCDDALKMLEAWNIVSLQFYYADKKAEEITVDYMEQKLQQNVKILSQKKFGHQLDIEIKKVNLSAVT